VIGFQTQTARSGSIMDGLVLYFPFDEDGGDVVRDASGNGHDGKVVGAQFTPEGKLGGAYRVGKRCGFIEVPANKAWSLGLEPFSIAVWVKLISFHSREQNILGCNEGGGELNKWTLQFYEGCLGFHINNPQSISARIAASSWYGRANEWHHLAVTREADTYCIYINGQCTVRGDNSHPVPAARAPLTIGQAEGLFIEGLLDEVMLFNRALAPEEVLTLFMREGPLAGEVTAQPTSSKPKVESLKMSAELVDGSVVIGELKQEELGMQSAGLGKVAAPLAHLRELKFTDEGKLVSAKLQNGDVLVGQPLFRELTLTTAFGRVTLSVAHLRVLQRGITKAPEPKPPAPARETPGPRHERIRVLEL